MHIVQVSPQYYPHLGGVTTHVKSISEKLVSQGHSVTVVCSAVKDDEPTTEYVNGVKVTRIPSIGTISDTNITPTLPLEVTWAALDADIIHTHLPDPWCADVSAAVGQLTKVPTVLTYHNDIVSDGPLSVIASVYNNTVLKCTLSSVNEIIITQQNYINTSPYLQRYADKISLVPNGVDLDHFDPTEVSKEVYPDMGLDPNRKNIFFLSILSERHKYKGLPVLLKALRQLQDVMGVDCPKLVVGGDGPIKEKYEHMADDIGVSENVSFLGRVPDGELVDIYSSSDLFVLPSTSSDQEGFGLVAVEALACETPVVTTNVVGVADNIKNQNLGEVVEKENPSALASGIKTALENQEQYNGMRELCEEQYSWSTITDDLVNNVYLSLID